MNKLKMLWARLFIPKRSPYCHHRFKKDAQGRPYAKACRYWTTQYDPEWKYEREYCRLMQAHLSLDDQIKDCGLNDNY